MDKIGELAKQLARGTSIISTRTEDSGAGRQIEPQNSAENQKSRGSQMEGWQSAKSGMIVDSDDWGWGSNGQQTTEDAEISFIWARPQVGFGEPEKLQPFGGWSRPRVMESTVSKGVEDGRPKKVRAMPVGYSQEHRGEYWQSRQGELALQESGMLQHYGANTPTGSGKSWESPDTEMCIDDQDNWGMGGDGKD